MEAERRTLKRKPLSDCSNIVATRNSTKSLVKPSKFLPPTVKVTDIKDANTSTNSKSETTVCSSNNDSTAKGNCPSPRNIDLLSTPLRLPNSQSTTSGNIDILSTPLRLPNSQSTTSGLGEHMTVYTSRQSAEKRKLKGKMVADQSSCPPAERIKNLWEDSSVVGFKLSKSFTAPRKKKQRKVESEKDEHALSRDYIEQQKAYFAEIDAFELPEEVASESE